MGLDSMLFDVPRRSLDKGDRLLRDGAREIAYWRKENWLHKWMVENLDHIVEGDDEVGELTLEKAKEFLGLIDKVLEDNSLASELLPTCSGFFFGSTEYDESYFDGLRDAKEQISHVIKDKLEEPDEDWVVLYVPSW